MSQYNYETFAQNVYDNFSDNNIHKNWMNFEKLWKQEKGEGIVKENSYIDLVNINDTSDVNKKKCLVIKASGDDYKLNEPKGLKDKSSKRVGGGVKSKHLMGPGEYNLRVKFSAFDSVCNAIWLFNYLELESDDYRHPKNPNLCQDNDVDNIAIYNPEIDFESISNNKCRCNIFRSTNGAYKETNIDLSKLDIEIHDKKWHNLKYIWNTDLVLVKDIIGRELNNEELVINKENIYINNIKSKKYDKLNGMPVFKSIKNNNNYCIYYGKSVKILIDDKKIYEYEIKNVNMDSILKNPIPVALSHFYIALWFPNFIKKNPDFHHTTLAVDTFEYKYNGDPFIRLNTE